MTAQSKPVPIKEKSQSFPSYLLALYLQQLHTNPLRTKAITSGMLSGLQEFVAQELSGTSRRRKGKAKEIDQSNLIDEKILKMALYGFLVSGPLNHLLFEMLNKLFKNRTGDSSKLMQILTSQLIITPIQNTVYLIAMAVIGGINDPAQIRKTVRKSLWPIMKMSWIVSPMAMGFAQRFLPPQLWVPFFNLVGFVFGVIANTKAKKVQQRKLDNKDQDELDD
ncbi:hypothetical protein RhiirA5_360708 [Rhizophagus irregularis]|uniref:Integral membrane protein n=1 Tax=Rhizophagus irregularis TaxID=588596 RepID=A0A2I1EK56_9GLOM|nr:hypothetical protein RhiirA5_360708 [Rhizophagus irregularis]PKY22509.1 hypothetical protein RhiirB3_369307 [Rhizophagus irregularis]CAB5157286.1 unnamed protein product [Rhizophagus irregularis]CAB5390054.1 unnamed protein product [Rhizophagus irregularis]